MEFPTLVIAPATADAPPPIGTDACLLVIDAGVSQQVFSRYLQDVVMKLNINRITARPGSVVGCQPSCSCVSPANLPLRTAPGRTADVEFVIQPPCNGQARSDDRITLLTDPPGPPVELALGVSCTGTAAASAVGPEPNPSFRECSVRLRSSRRAS